MAALHEMTRTSTPDRGVEVWSCTQCARRLLLRRLPEFEKMVLEPGDEAAAHVGGTGALRPVAVTANAALSYQLAAQDRHWLAELGIGWEDPSDPSGSPASRPPG